MDADVYEVPVLVVAFNRPDRLEALIERLRVVQPRRVYVVVDGPRAHVPGDAARVAATRALVPSIDWTPDVRSLFREENLGCGRGVSSAIDWLFAHEERGVILEDDVLPQVSLFPFCDELLTRYAGDARVWAVSGCNFVPPEQIAGAASYRFSTVPHVWGWATWRRAWAQYRYDIRGWRSRAALKEVRQASGSPWEFLYWLGMFELTSRGLLDTWDYQADLAAFRTGALTATANVNLVENVGFGAGATHTQDRPGYLQEAGELAFPLVHPPVVAPDAGSQRWTREHVLRATPGGFLAQGRSFLRTRAAR